MSSDGFVMSRKKIPYADPYVTEEDAEAVAEAVRNKRLSQGEIVARFERDFAYDLGRKYAVAAANGTVALHMSVLAVGVKPGDEVIVPSFTMIATANCVLYVGAKPVFADIDPDTYNIDPASIKEVISRKTRAIIVVHYGGQAADMNPMLEIAEEHNLHLIEDACEAQGATYKNHKVGAMGEIGCFSFYPNKNMTTGEGGMLVTDDEKLAERIRLFRNHGQDSRFHHVTIGYNYRMTDLQAALGTVQLKRLDWVIQRKREAAQYYEERLSRVRNIQPPYVMPDATHTYMLYTVKFPVDGARDRVMAVLSQKGVETVIAFPPVHLQPFYRSLYGFGEGCLPVTEDCARMVLSLPIYPHIRKEDQQYVVDGILEGLGR